MKDNSSMMPLPSMSRNAVIWSIALFVAAGMVGCEESSPLPTPSAEGPLKVFVSVPPQKYIVKQVGGDHVRVTTLVSPGQTPHTFEPTPKQVVQLSQADVYLRTGMQFENQLAEKVSSTLGDRKIVDLRQGLELVHHECEHRHEGKHEGHDHHHPEIDPHIWMNPRLVKKQAETIKKVLSELDPAHAEDYEKNCRQFQDRLSEVDRKIARILEPLKGKEFFVYHPAFGYFAQAYGLEQVAVEIGGRQPTARQIQQLIEKAQRNKVRLIFVQPQFSSQSAEVIARRIDGAVVPLNALAEDYMENLLHIAKEIKKALSEETTRPVE
jgi:zinc transport system substrate-binding protein